MTLLCHIFFYCIPEGDKVEAQLKFGCRIGQKRKVQVIKYVTKDSIEEKIYELQKRKKVLSDSVIEADELFVNNLTKDEILELFK